MRIRLRRVADLEARVAALEAQVAARDSVEARLADLTDVVAELLLPLHQRDDRRVDQILSRYRSGR